MTEGLVGVGQAAEGLADVMTVPELLEQVEGLPVGREAVVRAARALVGDAEAVPRFGLAHQVGFVLVQDQGLAAAEHGVLVGAQEGVAPADHVQGVRVPGSFPCSSTPWRPRPASNAPSKPAPVSSSGFSDGSASVRGLLLHSYGTSRRDHAPGRAQAAISGRPPGRYIEGPARRGPARGRVWGGR